MTAGTIIVGGGPAGTAPLIAALRAGRLPILLQAGLTLVERSDRIGGGTLGNYAVNSDSSAETFLTCVANHPDPGMAMLADCPPAREIATFLPGQSVPLPKVGAYLGQIGTYLHGAVERGGGAILTQHDAISVRRAGPACWITKIRSRIDGHVQSLTSRNVVIATGGQQSWPRIAAARVAGQALGARCKDRLMMSDMVLAHGGSDEIARRLVGHAAPRIAIVGGSTSALAVANMLLGGSLPLKSVTLLHRRKLRPFYHSAAAALSDGFRDFGPEDICPVSGFVYRLGGFRLDARDLVLRALRIGGREPDPRLHLHLLQGEADSVAAKVLDDADIVIGALGYRPRALPVLDTAGRPIALAAHAPGSPPLVNRACRVLGADLQELPGLFGIGLAAGFVPSGALGGEASFRGQANGLWLWQNAVGAMIAEQLCGAGAESAVA